jgi:hypothetical protein
LLQVLAYFLVLFSLCHGMGRALLLVDHSEKIIASGG